MADRRTNEIRIGVDVGAALLKVVALEPDGTVAFRHQSGTHGRPRTALRDALAALAESRGRDDEPVLVGATGGGAEMLLGQARCTVVNEVAATALGASSALPRARTVIDLGGQYSKWIRLDPDNPGLVVDFASNGLCAAGSGAFLEQQASRLHVDVAELGAMASRASAAATIAGRCSVFAKSDMIHLQQKGTPAEDIALGLCFAVARSVAGTVIAGRQVEAPVALVGGGAANPGLRRAFRVVLDLQPAALLVPDEPFLCGAVGAARMAPRDSATTLAEVLAGLASSASTNAHDESSGLAPLGPFAQGPARMPDEAFEVDGGEPVDVFLGVDVGSVSTNVVLIDDRSKPLYGVYRPTRGRPVAVLDEALRETAERVGDRVRIRGVGTTGSGRHLAARLLGADAVHNEITAQMLAAVDVVPDVDTIFEIGGQDSKYIQVEDGRLADFEMNKICSAGTGSFLEEQAQRLGIDIFEDFARLALASQRPLDLGTRCTVFMDAELVRAQERGAPLEDLCAGLAYSVARNYLEKVVAGRPVGKRIVFQGGTASNAAVVAAFRALLGRSVEEHPYRRLSGAIGAALIARRAKEREPYETRFRGFDACSGATSRSVECRHCENRCRVNSIRVGDRRVHFGDQCERYSALDREHAHVERPFAELFTVRQRLLDASLGQVPAPPDATPIGLLRAGLNVEYLPLWTAFLRDLGYEPLLSPTTSDAVLSHGSGAVPAEVCLPVKAVAAHARAVLGSGQVSRVFVPCLVECPPRAEDCESSACIYNQQLGDMLRSELDDRVATAQFTLGDAGIGLLEPTLELAAALGRPHADVLRALRRGMAVQEAFSEAREAEGREALKQSFDRAVVVLGKPYNTHDPFLNLSLSRHLERLGLFAIPWDLMPLGDVQLESRWNSVPWHFNREQLRAVELVKRDPRLFPIHISSFGCGPDGFLVRHLERELDGRPRLLLEFDEHRGEAGLVTRLEAFADEIEEHLRARPREPRPVRRATAPAAPIAATPRRVFLPDFWPHSAIYEAIFRVAGWDPHRLPPTDASSIRLGESFASGRECHPFAIFLGDLARGAQEGLVGDGDAFFHPGCEVPCLLRQYGDGHRMALQEGVFPDVEVLVPHAYEMGDLFGTARLLRLYEGLTAVDVLFTLARRLRPYVHDVAALDGALSEAVAALVARIESWDRMAPTFGTAAREIWELPRDGAPGDLPVVGVTGDLYTRVQPAGNARLFERLESLGCEVWPSPYMGGIADITALEVPRLLLRGRWRSATNESLSFGSTNTLRELLTRRVPEPVRELAVEPSARRMRELGARFVSATANHLVLQPVGKLADFLERGASGAVSAAGLNCMVGPAVAAVMPRIRAAYEDAPVIPLVYGGQEGPAQRIRLETFVHQVRERWGRGRTSQRAPA